MQDFFEALKQAATVFGYSSAVVTALTLLVRPIRDRVFGVRAIVSGLKCLLRADMLGIYYRGHHADKIRQHERENFEAEYRAYKALGGNSFIDDIHSEVKKWEVIT